MYADHLVKIGLLGAVGRFRTNDGTVYPRDCPVICRTERGLEVGRVLCDIDRNGADDPDGALLRQVSAEDQMIIDRLDRFRDRAFLACQAKLAARNIPGVLVDVEHLFDGQSVFFYFLGTVTEEMELVTEELAKEYERKVRFRKFAETLANGCGPGCGTTASKCGTGGCSSCGLAGGCGTSKFSS